MKREIIREGRISICEDRPRLRKVQEMVGLVTGVLKPDAKAHDLAAQGENRSRPPKILLALYRRSGLNIARAGAPSPLSNLRGRQISS